MVLLQRALYELQERCELTEHQHTVASFDNCLNKFKEGVDLAGPFYPRGVIELHAAGRAAQPGEFRQYIDTKLLALLDNALFCFATHHLIERHLVLREFHVDGDFSLLGQFLGHRLLGTAEHKGRDECLQLLLAFVILQVGDRDDVFLVELLVGTEEPGVDELEEVPELTEVVLYGSTGEDDAAGSLELHADNAGLGAPVFDDMSLIKAGDVPLLAGHAEMQRNERPVGGEDDVAIRGLIHNILTIDIIRDDVGMEARGKALDLVAPVGYDAGRSHHQGRPLFGLIQQEGYGLHGLTQAHIVSQTSSGAPHRQTRHPLEALHLIGTQCGFESLRYLRLYLFGLFDALLEPFKLFIMMNNNLSVDNLAEQGRLEV